MRQALVGALVMYLLLVHFASAEGTITATYCYSNSTLIRLHMSPLFGIYNDTIDCSPNTCYNQTFWGPACTPPLYQLPLFAIITTLLFIASPLIIVFLAKKLMVG